MKCLSESINKVPDAKAVYQVQKFLAVAKFVPTGTSMDDVIVDNPHIIDSHNYGMSTTVKLSFKDSVSHDHALKNGIFVDYTHFNIIPYVSPLW